VNRGIAETRGDLVALLDADDVWLPGKLRRQVDMLVARPELGLVYADMTAVNTEGAPFDRESMLTWITQREPLPYRAAARILWTNEAIESTILVRREVLVPVPEELPLADWWIALQAALQSEIDWVRAPLALYRMHGANMNSGQQSGVGSAPNPRVFLTDIRWKLLAARRLDLGVFTPAELVYIWSGIERSATEAIQAAQSYYLDFTDGVALDLSRFADLLAGAREAHEKRRYAEATTLAFQALIWNPYSDEARRRMRASASAFAD
jgi:glycosyltransferase involved in cell wall biosynthesis